MSKAWMPAVACIGKSFYTRLLPDAAIRRITTDTPHTSLWNECRQLFAQEIDLQKGFPEQRCAMDRIEGMRTRAENFKLPVDNAWLFIMVDDRTKKAHVFRIEPLRRR